MNLVYGKVKSGPLGVNKESSPCHRARSVTTAGSLLEKQGDFNHTKIDIGNI